MKRLLLMIVFLGLAWASLGDDRAVSSEPQPDKANSENANKKPDLPPLDKNAQQAPPPNWPRPYKPSEEVRADSSVPFPVDI
jgi:hypothetical protein